MSLDQVNIYKTKFHHDHRRIGYYSIFQPTETGETVKDTNIITIPQSNTITAWHYHQKQWDMWFVPQGAIQVGLYDDVIDKHRWVFLSERGGTVVQIPPNVWHGWKSLTPDTILLYGITELYDGTDEQRATIDKIGLNWDLGVQ